MRFLVRTGLVSIWLLVISSATAQPIHEEVEPNDTPAAAIELAGDIRIRGAFGQDDKQDAYIWSVSEADSRRRWTFRLDGKEGPSTVLWLLRLTYRGSDRAEVTERKELLTMRVAAGSRPAQLTDVLVPAGEYLIGLSPLGSLNTRSSDISSPLAGLKSSASILSEQTQGAGQSDSGDGPQSSLNNRYELTLTSDDGADPGIRSATEKKPVLVSPNSRTTFLSSDAVSLVRFSIGGSNVDKRWTLSGSTALGSPASVQLLNAEKKMLAQANLERGNQFEIPSLVLPAGEYRVAINSSATRVPRLYSVSLKAVGQFVQGQEAEPNDYANQANQFELDKPLAAKVDKPGENDYFVFDIDDNQANRPFDLSVVAANDNEGLLCLQTITSVAIQCRKGKGRIVLENLELPAARYRLAVTRFRQVGPYTIATQAKPRVKPSVESEPNDVPAFAHDMGRRKVLTGTLTGPDVDVIAFEVTDPDVQYRVQTKGVGRMTIKDEQGRIVTALSAPTAAGVMRAESLDLLPGRYQATLSHGQAEKYRLIVRNQGQLPADFEREPNDDLAGGLRLRLGEPRRGMLPSGDPRDIYVFRLDGRDRRRISVTAPDDGPVNVRLNHYGGHFGSVALKAGESYEFDAELDAGFYTLILSSRSGKSQGHYRVALDFADDPVERGRELEPNNWFADGQWLTPGGRMLGVATGLGGSDYFRVRRPEQAGYLVQVCDPSTQARAYAGFTNDEFARTRAGRGGRPRLNVFPFQVTDDQIWFTEFRSGQYDCRLFAEPLAFSAPDEKRLTRVKESLDSGAGVIKGNSRIQGHFTPRAGAAFALEIASGVRSLIWHCELTESREPIAVTVSDGNAIARHQNLGGGWARLALLDGKVPRLFSLGGPYDRTAGPFQCDVFFSALDEQQFLAAPSGPVKSVAAGATLSGTATDFTAQIPLPIPGNARLMLLACTNAGGTKRLDSKVLIDDKVLKPQEYLAWASGASYFYSYAMTNGQPKREALLRVRADGVDHQVTCKVWFTGFDAANPAREVAGPAANQDAHRYAAEQAIAGAVSYQGVFLHAEHRVRIPVAGAAGSVARVACKLAEPRSDRKLTLKMRGGDRGQRLADDSVVYRLVPDESPDELIISVATREWARPIAFQCDVKPQADWQPWPADQAAPEWKLESVELSPQRIAAYRPSGQQLEARLVIQGAPESSAELSLNARVTGRNWRLAGLPSVVIVNPGERRVVPFTVAVAPNASILTEPRVIITATEHETSKTIRSSQVAVDPTLASEVRPVTVNQTPAALMGGFNVLDVRRGARVVSIDGKAAPDPGKKPTQDAKHNGEAPVESGSGIGGRDIVFEVAGDGVIPLRGFVMSLRSISPTENWVHTLDVSTSVDGVAWSEPLRWRLESVLERQHRVLPAPVNARFVRLTLQRDFGFYARLFFNEFMAIAEPGTVPSGWQTIDLGDRRWGGHVVATRGRLHYPPYFTDPQRKNLYFDRDKVDKEQAPPSRYVTLGFAGNRRARITGVQWVKSARDKSEPTAPLEVWVAEDQISGFKLMGSLHRPGKDEPTTRLDFDQPVWARFVKFETPGSAKAYWLPDAIRIFEAKTSDSYRSVTALWDEDDRSGPFEWFHPVPAAPLVKAGGRSPADAPALKVGDTIESVARFGDEHDDWFRIGPLAPGASRLVFGLDGRSDLRQTALTLTDQQAQPVPLEVLDTPPVGINGNSLEGQVFKEQRPDRKLYAATLEPDQVYFARISVPGRQVALRAENVGAVRARNKAITRSLRAWADTLSGEIDGIQLPGRSAYDGKDGFVRSRGRILKALNDAGSIQGGGTSSFSTAIEQTAAQMAPIDGAKLMMGFATGAIFNAAEDFWYLDVLQKQPIRFWSMYLACPGVFGCPEPRASTHRMRAAAAAANGEFRRIAYPDDVEDSLEQAMVYLNGPKSYRLSVEHGRPILPSEMEPGFLVVRYGQALQKQLIPAVSIVLDASGSMLKRMPGSKSRRIQVARDSLAELINNGLPENVAFSYRAFGLKAGACDTKALIRLGKLNKKSAIKAINKTPVANRAKTAIAASLVAAAGDLSKHRGPKTIVIVTDGEETCGGDVVAAIEALKTQGLDVKIQIVGFAIDDEALKQQFAQWASLGGGQYFDASDKAVLTSSLISAVANDYRVTSVLRNDTPVSATVGERVSLAPGTYQLDFGSDVAPPVQVTITSGKTTGHEITRTPK